jgi:hypothetical protein
VAKQLTDQDFLDAIDRAIPDSYLDPMKVTGDGYEMIRGQAAIGARASLAVQRFEDDGYIRSSQGPAQATVVATFYREHAAAGAGTVLIGSLVRCSRGGQVFRTTEDAIFGALDLEVSVDAVAIGYGYEWNIKGPFTDPAGAVWPGELDTIDLPLMDPPYWDRTVLVRNDADADGLGRPATLDAIGAEREVLRQPLESDHSYRLRIRAVPNAVTPAAITLELTNFFRPYGLAWRLVEPCEHEYQECFDAPDEPATIYEAYDANLFSFDDPRPRTPIQNRLLGEQDHLGSFILEMESPRVMEDYGFAFDDPMSAPTPPYEHDGEMAFSAFDVPDGLPEPVIEPALDGVDFVAEQLMFDLATLLEKIAAGGVYWVIHIQEQES